LKISFIDSGVLIAAVRGTPEIVAEAREILLDPESSFASSAYVWLEVLPKASFHRQEKERAFYEGFFDTVSHWAPIGESLVEEALEIASRAGLSALDALHVAAALAVGADELITCEKPGRPVHRVRGITVRTIYTPRS
jgi:predicted nucleic acid-binding protein